MNVANTNGSDTIVPIRNMTNFEFDMKGFVVNLGKLGESVFTGASCTYGHTQLYLEAKQLCKQTTELCDAGVLLVDRYKQVIGDAQGDLEVAFEFLKSACEDMAIDMIKQIGGSCDTLAVETNKFKDKINNVQISTRDLKAKVLSTYTVLQKKYEALMKKETEQQHAESVSQANFDLMLEQIRENIKIADDLYNKAIKHQQDVEQKISRINAQKKISEPQGNFEIPNEQQNKAVQDVDQIISSANAQKSMRQSGGNFQIADEQFNKAIKHQQYVEQIISSANEQKNMKEIQEKINFKITDEQNSKAMQSVVQKISRTNAKQNTRQSQDNSKTADEQYNIAFQDVEQKISCASTQQNINKSNTQQTEDTPNMQSDVSVDRSGFQVKTGQQAQQMFASYTNHGQNQKYQKLELEKELKAAEAEVLKAGQVRRQHRAAETQLWQNRVQESAAKLGQKYEAKDDPSLLTEGDPFFENALKHSQMLLDILEGVAQLWATMGESYGVQLPEKFSSEMNKEQEEREQMWNSDEFLLSAQKYTQTWTMLKDLCNVMNEIRITQQHVLSYVANEPTNVEKVRELLSREKRKLGENPGKN